MGVPLRLLLDTRRSVIWSMTRGGSYSPATGVLEIDEADIKDTPSDQERVD